MVTWIIGGRARLPLKAATTGAILSIFLGCSSMRTVDSPVDGPQTTHAYTGVHYFLPRGVIEIVGNVQESGKAYEITVARFNEPDRTQRYRLVQNSSIFHDDVTNLKVNDKGLLSEDLAITSESRSAEVIYNITDTALNIAKIYAKTTGASPMTASGLTPPPTAPADLKSFKVRFDPLIAKERRQAKAMVEDAGFHLEVETGNTANTDAKNFNQSEQVREAEVSHAGVFYRPLTTVKISLQCRSVADLAINQNVPVPDPHSIAVYSLKRGVLIKKSTTLTFVDGEPRGMQHSKPSELLGASAIPSKVTASVLSALPSLGALVYKPSPSQNAKLDAETARLNAETASIRAHTDALNAKKAAAEAAAKEQNDTGNTAADTAAATAATLNASMSGASLDAKTKIDILEKRVKDLEEGKATGAPRRRSALEDKPANEPKPDESPPPKN
jgi:hypothetical protein